MFQNLTTSRRPAAFVSRALSFLCLCLTLVSQVDAATPDEWRGRSIYQIITDRFGRTDGSTSYKCNTTEQLYCGGTFQGIIQHLDYIQGMGFTAIWISPIVTNIDSGGKAGESYHGFYAQDITTVNKHFGTADDLVALSKALHDRDMYLMIDVVTNNMAYEGPGQDTNYSMYTPFNDKSYFHPFCYITDYGNWTQAQQCWLGSDLLSLPDLDTESEKVIKIWENWGKEVVANYSIDGFRIDAAKHVAKPFWALFYPAVDVYMVGEVDDGGPTTVCSYQSNTEALPGVLNYAMWYSITDVFPKTSKNMSDLAYQYSTIADVCQDSTLLGTFTENQDVARFGWYTNDTAQRENAVVFALLSDGIPIIYYGAEQGYATGKDPQNREALWLTDYDTSTELYKTIAATNLARNVISDRADYSYWSPYWTWKSIILLSNENVMVLRKGYDYSVLAVVTNKGSNAPEMGPYAITNTNFNSGDVLVDTIGCTQVTVGEWGNLNITVPAGGRPMVLVPAKWIKNTTACPDLLKTITIKNDTSKDSSSGATGSMPLHSTTALLVVLGAAIAFL